MRLLIGLVVSGLVFGQASNAPSQIELGTSGPGGVGTINLQVVGNQGNTTSYYWVIPNYNIGLGQASRALVINAPNVLGASNYVRVTWNPVVGATGYFVLKTTGPDIPTSCSCALVGPTLTIGYNDQGGGLAGFNYTPVGAATAHIGIDNQSYNIPRLVVDTPINPTLFVNLPAAPLSAGLTYLVTDAVSFSSCNAGGGSNTPAQCWSNGTSWIAIGGSGGGGGMVYPGAGVASSSGVGWSASYTVGTAANNLVQLNGSGQLPAISGALLTNLPSGLTPAGGVNAVQTNNGLGGLADGGCTEVASVHNCPPQGGLSGMHAFAQGTANTPPANTTGVQGPTSVPVAFLNTLWGTPTDGYVMASATPPYQMTVGLLKATSLAFGSLATPANGTQIYCTDCTVTSGIDNTCAGSGSGAMAFRINGAWRCVQ